MRPRTTSATGTHGTAHIVVFAAAAVAALLACSGGKRIVTTEETDMLPFEQDPSAPPVILPPTLAADVPCDLATAYHDADGDGDGAPDSGVCTVDEPQAGYSFTATDCDDSNAQRDRGFYERFGDGIDSDCDGEDDPSLVTDPCSCAWSTADAGNPTVITHCKEGFDPKDAAEAVATADVDRGACTTQADLALVFAAQCASLCSGGPIYFAVANLGGRRSEPTSVSLRGRFRQRPPHEPLVIEALEPGQHTGLIEVRETGDFRLQLDTRSTECDKTNDELPVVVLDAHCGFDP